MILLGIDFGLSKLGLAFAESGLVSPHGVVANSPGVLSVICLLCQERQVEKVIIGSPDKSFAAVATAFAEKVRNECGLPVEFQDETLTTKEAIDRMIRLGKKRSKRKKEDAFAAAIMLEEYLEGKEKYV